MIAKILKGQPEKGALSSYGFSCRYYQFRASIYKHFKVLYTVYFLFIHIIISAGRNLLHIIWKEHHLHNSK
jgi:hypothetical protein